MNTCHNNLEKSSRTKINKHTALVIHCSHAAYLVQQKISLIVVEVKINFCLDLEQHVTKIIKYEEKEMISLTKKAEKIYNKQNKCYICKKRFTTGDNNKKYHEVRDRCHYTGKCRAASHSIYNLR